MKIAAPHADHVDSGAQGAFEPYAQLIRALLPRTSTIALFDRAGDLQWSTDAGIGADLVGMVEEVTTAARAERDSPGQLRRMPGDGPVYLFCLRDDAGELCALLVIGCRAASSQSAGTRDLHTFTFVHSLLKPALECLRRDLLARESIATLSQRVTSLDRDLEMVLGDPAGADDPVEGSNDLKTVLQNAVERLGCDMAALIVPDKGLVLMRPAAGGKPDGQLVARIHRQLVSMAHMRREPVIINRLAPSAALGTVPYRILSCPVRNPAGRTSGVLALFRHVDRAELVGRDARLAELVARKAAAIIEASYDALTGLYTRPAFEQRVRAAVATSRSWCALYVDSDQLHVINDNHGMHVGDRVIAQLGELLRRRLPPNGFAARISGDRFAALLPTGLDDAAQFAESLREGAVGIGALHGDARVHVSVSIGVAALDRDAGELTHCLAAAETACKAAKDRGRNRVESYAANDASIVRRFADINIAARLRAALAADRLRLDAQLILPFDTLTTDARPHFELLLRMIDEDGTTVGPDRFLSAANRYQLMPAIDRWVIDKAIALLAPHADALALRPAVFAINFSGQSLSDEGFGEFLLGRIRASGLDPALFCFELTETATVANIARAEVLMNQLRSLGCGVALDDFGTGVSSLSYLRQLPVTMLKIDGSFVRDILTDARAESMVKAIAQLARGMSIATVAEYVETEEIRGRVAALGVDYGQGFAIGRPALIEEVLAEIPVLAAALPVACARTAHVSELLELEPDGALMAVAH
jgi:diguanylate cyclase (GGDEF)-like protein